MPGGVLGGQSDVIVDRAHIEAALPGYEVGDLIGTGGFGLVFAARHVRLERPAAIKILVPEMADSESELGVGREVFAAEARLLARLTHPHIVRVFDYVERRDLCMIVMELCAGGTLRARASRGLAMAEVVAFGLAMATALDAAHRSQVIHRDIKPDNVLFTSDHTLKITDFGIAKIVETTTGRGNTIVGTPVYMAPEQFTGAPLRPATDLYALGTVLYELLSGQTPFSRRLSPVELAEQHLRGFRPPPPGSTPPAIGGVVVRALDPDPARRQRSALGFALELAAAAARDFGPGWLSACPVPVHLPDVVLIAATASTQAGPAPAHAGPAPAHAGPASAHAGPASAQAGPAAAQAGPDTAAPADTAASPDATAPTEGPVLLPRGRDTAAGRETSTADSPLTRRQGLLRRWAGRRSPRDEQPATGPPGRGGRPAPAGRAVVHLRVESPFALAVAPDGALYVSQPLAHRVLRVDAADAAPGTTKGGPPRPTASRVTAFQVTASQTVVAGTGKAGRAGDGGPATAAELDNPAGLAVTEDGTLLIADCFNDRIRRVDPDGTITTVPTPAALRRPRAVTTGPGGVLLIADTDSHRVWRLGPGETARVIAGTAEPGYSGDGGPATRAAIGRPQSLAVDGAGRLLIADPDQRRIRRVDHAGRIGTMAGTAYGGRPAADGAPATGTDVGTPTGLAVGPDGTVYLADPAGDRVLAIHPDGRVAVAAARSGEVPVLDPKQVAVGPDGTLYIAQPGRHRITAVAPAYLPHF
ncbi:protein kinase [Frankia sp. EAN1pec]|uniref:protein kinase domain-containing protein n=1 Tax=Parafrankia sp. (strain EAN1pec) TaxID=298653 RepID=UPI0002EE3396